MEGSLVFLGLQYPSAKSVLLQNSISSKAAHILPIRIRSMEDFKDSTGSVGYYTNREEKKRPRKIHFSPKAVLVLQTNSPSVSAVTVSLTHVAALGRFQKSKNVCGSTSMRKER